MYGQGNTTNPAAVSSGAVWQSMSGGKGSKPYRLAMQDDGERDVHFILFRTGSVMLTCHTVHEGRAGAVETVH